MYETYKAYYRGSEAPVISLQTYINSTTNAISVLVNVYFLFYDSPRHQCVFVFDRVTCPYIGVPVVFAAPGRRVFSRTVVSRPNMRRLYKHT